MERVDAGTPALDAAAVERVLKRAHDLSTEQDSSPFAGRTVSEEVVVAAAAEVGIAPEMVRMSLAIERLGPIPEQGGLDGLTGPGAVIVQRAIELAPDEVLTRLDDLLVRKHQLRRERTWPAAMQWRKRTDAIGFVQRTVSNLSGQAPLGKAASITAVTSAVDTTHTIVRLTLDRADKRTGALTGGAVVATTGTIGVVVLAAAATPFLLLASPLAVAAGIGVSARGKRHASESARELECLLDNVEQGAQSPALTRVVRQLTRATRRVDRATARRKDRWL